jgi:protein-L-isoaspartate(D-aspartate) O-methyltransferase
MTFDFQAARLTMVESQVRTSDVTDYLVQDAMRIAPRETLCPAAKVAVAYADADLEYAPGLYLLRPRALGKLLQALKPQAHEKALCVAAPYAALVLRTAGLAVTEVAADKTPAKGAFDLIVSEGAVAEVPAAWLAALAEGGRMALIVRTGPMGQAHLFVKTDGRIASCEVFDAAAAYLPGHAPKAQFAF